MQQNLKIVYVEQEPCSSRRCRCTTPWRPAWASCRPCSEYEALTGQFGRRRRCPDGAHARHPGVLDAADAWNGNKVETVLDKLNLPGTLLMRSCRAACRSAWRWRALVSAPDVLLLDEPTNHLDFTSILWLEGLLRDFKGSVLFITHDRSFLDNVATRIIELDRGRLLSFPGNFSTYQTRKAELLENEEVENAKFDKLLAQEEVWIRKGVKARRVRDEGRVRRLEALRLQRARAASSRARSSWK
jgi:ATP-binding cassette subfamily F protein uup